MNRIHLTPWWVIIGLISIVLGLGTATAMQKDTDKEKRVLRHVVLFKFKESSSPEDIQRIVDAFRALPKKIPQIADFEYGTNNSPEGLNRGFTHCFLVTFRSEEDRAAYLPHPAHKEFVEILLPHLAEDGVLVVDYWAAE